MKENDNVPLGILMLIFSSLAFAGMHFFVKIVPDLPASQKVISRNFVSLIITLIMTWKAGILWPSFPRRFTDGGLLTLRCVAGLLGVVLNFYAIARLPLAESSLLNRLSPFFVMLFAVLFLRERLRRIDLLALIFVFVFVLMIIRPGLNLNSFPAFCGLLSGVAAGGAYTTLRAMRGRVEPITIIFYFSLFSVLSLLCFWGQFVMPTPKEWMGLLGIGITASLGQFFITYAYRFAPATEISVYNYTSVVFALILDWLVFADLPDTWSWIGCIGIISVAIALFIYNRREMSQAH